jgi:hypothetical protein
MRGVDDVHGVAMPLPTSIAATFSSFWTGCVGCVDPVGGVEFTTGWGVVCGWDFAFFDFVVVLLVVIAASLTGVEFGTLGEIFGDMGGDKGGNPMARPIKTAFSGFKWLFFPPPIPVPIPPCCVAPPIPPCVPCCTPNSLTCEFSGSSLKLTLPFPFRESIAPRLLLLSSLTASDIIDGGPLPPFMALFIG